VCFFFVLCVVYVRSALFDVFHAQGDLVVGAETLPVTIGEKRTLKLLKRIIVFGVLILVFAGLFHITTSFSFLLIFVFVGSYLTLFAYQRRWLYPGLRLEAMVEGSLLAAGGLGLAWQAWA
jgi:4-hydroxy-3-methylbut-2-enyl diphosphate reductase